MPGCSGEICQFRSNTRVPVTVSFTATQSSARVFYSGDILVNGRWNSIARNVRVCPLLTTGRCPLLTGGTYAFRSQATVRRFPVGTRSMMRFRVYNNNNVTVTCFHTSFQIVN